jgi:cytochrome c peroxidase
LAAGCQRAERYGGRPAPATPALDASTQPASGEPAPPPLDPTLQWEDPGRRPPAEGVRIEFVHPTKDPEGWRRLPHSWNTPLGGEPRQAATFVGLLPLASGAVAGAGAAAVVRVKVPLGLDDPTPHVPASNPLTLAKWTLGQRLFFDDTWLVARPQAGRAGVSCAGCHRPRQGFTDGRRVHDDGFNTPTLINCVYNARQFWDGRVASLEDVVQQTLEDERQPAPPGPFRHIWHGAVGRLRDNSSYVYQFEQVFGTRPTQDAVGRALATYLRTILAGTSVHDRAEDRARLGGQELGEGHYAAVLAEPGVLEDLGRPKEKAAEVARELHRGYRLFFDYGSTGRANCAACHSGRQFTDGGFHNLGLDEPAGPGQERGRFPSVPVGHKDRSQIDAYKTPTLRSLLRTAPYLHDGRGAELRDVISHHARRGVYLDPLMLDARDHVKGDELTDDEVAALVLFLRALNGDDVDEVFRTVPPR